MLASDTTLIYLPVYPSGTRITSVRARGAGTLTYSVVSVHDQPSADMFEVDADGQLILAKSLDREAKDR